MRNQLFDAVLFDRDGTLVARRPLQRRPGPGAADARRARGAGPAARAPGCGSAWSATSPAWPGAGSPAATCDAVNARVEELLGPFDTWQICPHDDGDGCGCRKPAPGLVQAAAAALGTTPGAASWSATSARDMAAAAAAGATRHPGADPGHPAAEVAAAPATAGDLRGAAELILRRSASLAPPGRRAPAPGRPRAGGPPGLGRRRAGDRAGDPGGGRRRRARRSCCAGRAAGPPPNCCPASTRSSSGGCRGSIRARAGRRGRRWTAWSAGSPPPASTKR